MNAWQTGLLVAGGGALGAAARYALNVALVAQPWPAATFLVNVTGSFLIGLVVMLAGARTGLYLFLATGVLGGFTTFSAFSLEMVRLVEDGRVALALGYALASVVIAVLATALGLLAGRAL